MKGQRVPVLMRVNCFIDIITYSCRTVCTFVCHCRWIMVIGLMFLLCSEGKKPIFSTLITGNQAGSTPQPRQRALTICNSRSTKVKRPILYKTEQQRRGEGTEKHFYVHCSIQWRLCNGSQRGRCLCDNKSSPTYRLHKIPQQYMPSCRARCCGYCCKDIINDSIGFIVFCHSVVSLFIYMETWHLTALKTKYFSMYVLLYNTIQGRNSSKSFQGHKSQIHSSSIRQSVFKADSVIYWGHNYEPAKSCIA